MKNYYKATIWINHDKPLIMILRGKDKKSTRAYITKFYMKLNSLYHNIYSLKIRLERVYLINGNYISQKEFNNLVDEMIRKGENNEL